MARRSPTRISASEMEARAAASSSSSSKPEEGFPSGLKWPQFRSMYLQAKPGSISAQISEAWINYHALEHGRQTRITRASPSRRESPKRQPRAKSPPKVERTLTIAFPRFVGRRVRGKVEKVETEGEGVDFTTVLPLELQFRVTENLTRKDVAALSRTSQSGMTAASGRLGKLCQNPVTAEELLHAVDGKPRPSFGVAKGKMAERHYFYIYQTNASNCISVAISPPEVTDTSIRFAPEVTLEDIVVSATDLLRKGYLTKQGFMDPNLLVDLLLRRRSCERNRPGLTKELFQQLYDPVFRLYLGFLVEIPPDGPITDQEWELTEENAVRDFMDTNAAALFTVWVEACTYIWPPIQVEARLLEMFTLETANAEYNMNKARLVLSRLRAVRNVLLSRLP